MSRELLGSKTGRLSLVQVVGYSVALLAPTAGLALNTSLTAETAGRAVPFVMLGSIIGVLFMAVPFIKFTRRFVHAGSIYAYNSKVLGAPTGFLSAWVLLLAYLGFAFGGIALVANFGQALALLGGWHIPWGIVGLVGLGLALILVIRDVRLSTNLVLVLEGLSVTFIVIISFVIVAQGGATHHLTWLPFQPNVPFSAVGLGMIFGFLSFFGFDVAATIGEESKNPYRNVPLAIIITLVVAGILYVFVAYAQTVGYGTSAGAIAQFAKSSTPMATLAQRYMGTTMAAALDVGATLSGFGALMASTQAASRIFFALSRDGLFMPRLAKVHPQFRTPYLTATTISVMGAILIVIPSGWQPASAMFGYAGTVGVLAFLISYGITSIADFVSEIRRTHDTGTMSNRRVRILGFGFIDLLALILIVFTLYANIYPIPAFPGWAFPYLVLAWVLWGVVLLYRRPDAKKQILDALSEHDGQVPELPREGDADAISLPKL